MARKLPRPVPRSGKSLMILMLSAQTSLVASPESGCRGGELPKPAGHEVAKKAPVPRQASTSAVRQSDAVRGAAATADGRPTAITPSAKGRQNHIPVITPTSTELHA